MMPPILLVWGLIYIAVQVKGAIDDVDKKQAMAKLIIQKDLEILKKDQELLMKDVELAALRSQQALQADTLIDLSYQSEYARWREKKRDAWLLVEKEELGWKK
ncbi:hypothetical protein CEUSTIGMA_g13709.t1 [Chlamydomonas eustigma]|uniref:Uncharacterized protein n=1 Tax=Chlamydomonas eustigma TaxID=1157962 RepID=A0A250XTA3_9CHLO|nr:hypothetical protein CEUSTIGMA_g13709.t1 [Chlamydomonas eustigma]|eukprot:GAX86297.1 hypothetical protein CEUSTIGMA_g13709.t1 [Chlamydomonas eustigma]